MNRPLEKAIKDNFFKALDQKTNWGKEQVKQLYIESCLTAALDYIDYTSELLPPITSMNKPSTNEYDSEPPF